MVRVGINGFGRIGRQVMRQALDYEDIEIVAVNDLWGVETFAHLLRYDSNYGYFPAEVEIMEDGLLVDGREVRFTSHRNPADIPWGELGVDIVIESTGFFRDRDQATLHLEAGAKKVIISAPAKQPDVTIVLGVNDESYDPDTHHIISNASCTTNCLAPMAKVLHEAFGIEAGIMNTIHSYTSDQELLDAPHADLRRARAAAVNMIPTTTGAAAAVGEVLPELKGKLDGFSVRVPTPTTSLLDLSFTPSQDVTVEAINEALISASEGELEGILAVTDEPLVSSDFIGAEYSAVVDLSLTQVVGSRLAKVVAWYDNEMGYATRIVDLASMIAANL